MPQRPPVHRYPLVGAQYGMEFGGLVARLVLFDGAEPKPRQLAAALMPDVVIASRWHRQDSVAARAPHMKHSATFAFADVVQESRGHVFSVALDGSKPEQH